MPRLALFDTISSLPGVRVPFEALTAVCSEEGILSLIDGAHGMGHIPISLSSLQPDFFISNAHKWLFAPRGCAVLYVPVKNQALMRSTLPTSHGFKPKGGTIGARSSLPPSGKSEFIASYNMVGTLDGMSYLCIEECIRWRQEVCGSENAIRSYCINLARTGGQLVADILGTKILDNAEHTITECCMVNVLLPLSTSPFGNYHVVKEEYFVDVIEFIHTTLIKDHRTFIALFFMQGQWWGRLSGQVYLDMSDFEWAGNALKDLCERVGKGEFLQVEA